MFDQLSGETALYPIIGDPIKFVKSPQRLSEKFEARKHNGICIPMQVPKDELNAVQLGLSKVLNVRGLLVTMPHKNAMFEYCSTSSETSKLLGVVSVVRRNPDNTWHGDMLDGLAYVEAQKKHGAVLEGARVFQAGAGGAGSAIAIAMIDAGVQELTLYDPNQERLKALVDILAKRGPARVIAGTQDPKGCSIIVNATPLGMSSQDPLPVPANLLKSDMFVGDVVAGHGVTPLLEAARAVGCKTASGVDMNDAEQDLMPHFFLTDDVD